MRHPGDNLRASDHIVRTVSLGTCRRLVELYHRQGGGANTATFRHGLFHRDRAVFDAACLGVAWWIPPTRSCAEASYEGDWRRVLSLSRLVCVPEAPRNAASFLLGRSIARIRMDGRWECLVTYASTRFGQAGAIYKATNWEHMGLTAPEAVWVNGDGHEVARKAGPHTRTKAEMEALGYRMVGRFRKVKYRMIL